MLDWGKKEGAVTARRRIAPSGLPRSKREGRGTVMRYEQGKSLEAFNCLYRELDQIYHGLAVRLGMSDSAFIILYTIAELGEGCLQKDIAAWCSLSRQTVNSSIQNLRAQGFLSLESGKGREKGVFLTLEGKSLIEKKIFPVMEMEKSAFEEMSPGESQKMLELMEKYVQLFRGKVQEGRDV